MKIPDERPHLEEVREFYADISYEYDGRREAYFVNLYQLFARCLREVFQERRFGGPFTTVLDAGCGTGSQVLYAATFPIILNTWTGLQKVPCEACSTTTKRPRCC
ncbi:MAG: hypothetical protein AAB195_06125, partial [candidate division NC10 bacterium]